MTMDRSNCHSESNRMRRSDPSAIPTASSYKSVVLGKSSRADWQCRWLRLPVSLLLRSRVPNRAMCRSPESNYSWFDSQHPCILPSVTTRFTLFQTLMKTFEHRKILPAVCSLAFLCRFKLERSSVIETVTPRETHIRCISHIRKNRRLPSTVRL